LLGVSVAVGVAVAVSEGVGVIEGVLVGVSVPVAYLSARWMFRSACWSM
jgi:hypothetical protein